MGTDDDVETLIAQLERDPAAFRRTLQRMRASDPNRFAAVVEHVRTELEQSNEREDRPLSVREIEELIALTSKDLRWSRARVLAEAVLRLREAHAGEGFRPMTPEEGRARFGRYRRRRSSIERLLLGQAATRAESPGRYRMTCGGTKPGSSL